VKRHNFTRNASEVHERELQLAIHSSWLIASRRYRSVAGNDVLIAHPGRIQPYEGPDFQNMCLIIDGVLTIGNGEFHRKTSDWFAHNHHLDKRYKDLMIHFVFIHDIDDSGIPGHTIIINPDQFHFAEKQTQKNSVNSLDDLQDYALNRVLRRSRELLKLHRSIHDPISLLEVYSMMFLQRRLSLRARISTGYTQKGTIHDFVHSECIRRLREGEKIPVNIARVARQDRGNISNHLFVELFVNCMAPYIVCFEIGDLHAFKEWYWTQPRLSVYHSLYRRFPDIPQSYMWQQQGVLEWIRENHPGGRHSCSEIFHPYLHFMIPDIQ